MAYVSLYRKYRSQTFEEVMGQEHVTKTLQNAIKAGKVSHAYLFCGTRGTGKTTTARILAKALNCENGPTPVPCNKCAACQSITAGSTMDVLEMDAASHTGVDDIEEIRENVKFTPMELRYKVFIIDEVHQLSKSAKDAFLKTLEEPPSYTVFILATTEPQSIPVTIRSRCQQFDFRRGSLKNIRDRLKFVAESEGVEIDSEALDLISVNADGSYRDALSIMEQILAYTEGSVTADDVNTVMGTVNHDFIVDLTDVLADCDEAKAFEAAADVVESGRDIQQILRSIAQHFRNLLFASVSNNMDNIAASKQVYERYVEQAARFSNAALLKAIEVFTEAEKDSRYNEQHRLLLELALLKVISFVKQSGDIETKNEAPQVKTVKKSAQPKSKHDDAVKTTEKKTESTKPIQEDISESAAIEEPSHPSAEALSLPAFDKVEAKWNNVMHHLRTISYPAHAFLSNAKPAAIKNGALVLEFFSEGLKDIFINEKPRGKSPTKKQAVLMAIQKVFGVANADIICEVASKPKAEQKKISLSDKENEVPQQNQENDDESNTLNDILDIFNGEIVD